MAETWPGVLSIGFEGSMNIMEFQGQLLEAKRSTGDTPTVQFQPASEKEKYSFNQLVKWLRELRSVGRQCSPQAYPLTYFDSAQPPAGRSKAGTVP
jgi:hypothetical protein